ncbi:MAG: hypothetical protein SWN10_15630 [Pseudomonadota bacterium]|nr:hypothetical protein [Pseudomonadota bacterium]
MTSYMGESLHIELLGRLPSSLLIPLVFMLFVCGVVSLGLVINRLWLCKVRLLVVIGLNIAAWLLLVALLSPVTLRDNEPPAVVLVTHSEVPLSEASFNDIASDASVWFTQRAWLSLSQTQWFNRLPMFRPKVVREPEDIIWAEPTLQHLVVIGDGMMMQQWQRFKQRKGSNDPAISVTLKKGSAVTGLVSMRWQRQLNRGQWQRVSGVLQVAPAEAKGNLQQTLYHVYLKDPAGQVVAQQAVRDGETFELLVNVKTEGLWQYQLALAKASDDITVVEENLAFEVTRPSLAKLLIRQSAPSFETRHVKNWAVEQGAQVTVETQISKNRYISQHANYPQEDRSDEKTAQVDSFDTLSTLDQYDLLIIDARGLMKLSQHQQDNLAVAVKRGLGVLVIGDSTLFTENNLPGVLNQFRISHGSTIESDQSLLSWQFDQAGEPLNVIAADIPASSGFSLVKGAEGRVIVPGIHWGLGKVAISLTNQTYQWHTAGQRQLYSRYWQFLFESLARQSLAPYFLPVENDHLNIARQPLPRCFSVNENLYSRLADYALRYEGTEGKPVALIPLVDEVNQNMACGVIYPASSGWQRITLSANEETLSHSFYVYNESDWPAWQQQRKHNAGKRMQSAMQTGLKQTYWTEISLWPLWWGLLLMCSLLWIERKFWTNRIDTGST